MTRNLPGAALALLLAGCASTAVQETTTSALAEGASRIGVQAQVNATGEQRREARATVDALLAQPLAADDAVRIALLHSPATQALLAEGQAMQAAAIQSGRIGNPIFVFERLLQGDHKEIERLLAFNLFDLLSLPWRMQIADAQMD